MRSRSSRSAVAVPGTVAAVDVDAKLVNAVPGLGGVLLSLTALLLTREHSGQSDGLVCASPSPRTSR